MLLPILSCGYALLLLFIEHWHLVLSATRPLCRFFCGSSSPPFSLSRRSHLAVACALALPVALCVAGFGFWGSVRSTLFFLLLALFYVFWWERRCLTE